MIWRPRRRTPPTLWEATPPAQKTRVDAAIAHHAKTDKRAGEGALLPLPAPATPPEPRRRRCRDRCRSVLGYATWANFGEAVKHHGDAEIAQRHHRRLPDAEILGVDQPEEGQNRAGERERCGFLPRELLDDEHTVTAPRTMPAR